MDMLFPSTVPTPMFVMGVYTVPENDRSQELCIDVGVDVTQPETYTIRTEQKSPPEAEGIYTSLYTCVHVVEYNETICCLKNCESQSL